MEDILASIRRILSEDDTQAGAAKPPAPNMATGAALVSASSDVLSLDESMLVAEPLQAAPAPAGSKTVAPAPDVAAPVQTTAQDVVDSMFDALTEPPAPTKAAPPPPQPAPSRSPMLGAEEPLVDPAAVAAAASSLGSLMRTLAAERHVPVHRRGPTIEDIVREELRPMLKQWLDTHLPATVERLVRQEIARVVGDSIN